MPLTEFEVNFLLHNLRQYIYHDVYYAFIRPTDYIMFDIMGVDECVSEYTTIIINLLHGEVKKRVNHTLSKINKHTLTKDFDKLFILPDYDEIIFDQFTLLMSSIGRFFADQDFEVPWHLVHMFSNTASDKFEWYPVFSGKITAKLLSLYRELQMKRFDKEHIEDFNEHTARALEKLEQERMRLESQLNANENLNHIIKTRLLDNTFNKLMTRCDFPKNISIIREKDYQQFIKHKQKRIGNYPPGQFWGLTARILEYSKFATNNLGLYPLEEDQKIDLGKLKEYYTKDYQIYVNNQLGQVDKHFIGSFVGPPKDVVCLDTGQLKLNFIDPNEVGENFSEHVI